MRKLWARVEDACGLAPEAALLTAETAWRMMTKRDPQVNMLRATIAACAAGLGGADAVTVLPFTMALGLPDAFARRVARNTQLVLLQESHLAKVSDPAAGSGSIEDLTAKLCRTAWGLFQEIEAAGGAATALAAGVIQRKIAASRAARIEALKDGRDALTGTTIFPNPDETPATVLPVSTVAPAAMPKAAVTVEPIPAMRLAEPFE
jgi:methylmalonyl-CoA mutase